MNLLKIALKIVLILVGGLMVVGGGVCAAVDLMFTGTEFGSAMTLFMIAATVAGVGLLLIWLATRVRAAAPDLEAGTDSIDNDK